VSFFDLGDFFCWCFLCFFLAGDSSSESEEEEEEAEPLLSSSLLELSSFRKMELKLFEIFVLVPKKGFSKKHGTPACQSLTKLP
jgi:hypothetical protein